jgi:2-dehydro-3-deoxyphosphogluconate aldolase / (4S)-4-hydroxy-2-oxoglutarate aldolase
MSGSRTSTSLAAIGAARVVPVLRSTSAAAATATAIRLLDEGVGCVELTTTTPDWLTALRAVLDHRDAAGLTAPIGVGTVSTERDALRAADAGADFLVSPFPVPEVRDVAGRAEIPFLEGGLTPGELASAAARGVAKLFPAHVGGVAYLSSVLAVLPDARIIPTGGIGLADVPAWLRAGAFAVGVGRDLAEHPDPGAAIRALDLPGR